MSTGYDNTFQPDTSGSKRLNAIYNNPGALGLAKWAQEKYGAAPSGKYDTGHPFSKFPTKEAGAAAQFDLWMRNNQFVGNTLKGAITNWIGPGEHGEAEYIASKLGIPLNTVITPEFLKGPMGLKLMQVQAEYEGANVISPEQWQSAQNWAYGNQTPASTTTGKFLNPATGNYDPLSTTPSAIASTTTGKFLNPATGNYEPLSTAPGATAPGTSVASIDTGTTDKIKEMNTLLAMQKAQQNQEVPPDLHTVAGLNSLINNVYKMGQQLNWWAPPKAQLVSAPTTPQTAPPIYRGYGALPTTKPPTA